MDKKHFEKIVGQQNVCDDPEILEEYSRDSSFSVARKPSLVVKPQSTSDVQAVIEKANDIGAALIPVSSTGPRLRGDTVPTTDDALVLDLSGLKKILWINRRNRVALVEPGTTYDELESELEKAGMRCLMPLLPKTGKSVVGACMEREPFTVPKYSWDLSDPVASAEFVLGNGNILRTGAAAGPGTLEEQREAGGAQKNPMGPLMMDVKRIAQGSQGNIGVCNWISLRCELLPEHERVYFVAGDDLEELIEFLYRSLYLKLVDEQYILNRLSFASLLEKHPKAIDALRGKLPNWILVASIGGYGEMAAEQFQWKDEDLHEEAERLGIGLLAEVGGITETDYRTKVVRKSSDDPYWKMRYKGDVRELLFLTSASKAPDFLKMALESGFNTENIGVYLQMVLQGKACHIDFDFHGTTDELSGFENGYVKLAGEMFNKGAYYSRPYGPLSDIVYNHEDYETFVKYARGLKDIFDPNRVLNPGKLCF